MQKLRPQTALLLLGSSAWTISTLEPAPSLSLRSPTQNKDNRVRGQSHLGKLSKLLVPP